jgi:hypothetical protein
MREHVKPSVRMHYVYKNGGQVPNVIQKKLASGCGYVTLKEVVNRSNGKNE